MAIGGNLFEKAISVEDGVDRLGRLIFKSAPEAVKKAINKYLGEMGTRDNRYWCGRCGRSCARR